MAKRDYSGVSTAALARFVRDRVPENQENWAETSGIGTRTLRKVMQEDYQWTGLTIADKATTAFGLRVDDMFEVIPGTKKFLCAQKMARDELETIAESWGLPRPTPEEINQRAEELEALRLQVLGLPTQAQIERLNSDAQRTKDRTERKNKGIQEADFKVFANVG